MQNSWPIIPSFRHCVWLPCRVPRVVQLWLEAEGTIQFFTASGDSICGPPGETASQLMHSPPRPGSLATWQRQHALDYVIWLVNIWFMGSWHRRCPGISVGDYKYAETVVVYATSKVIVEIMLNHLETYKYQWSGSVSGCFLDFPLFFLLHSQTWLAWSSMFSKGECKHSVGPFRHRGDSTPFSYTRQYSFNFHHLLLARAPKKYSDDHAVSI